MQNRRQARTLIRVQTTARRRIQSSLDDQKRWQGRANGRENVNTAEFRAVPGQSDPANVTHGYMQVKGRDFERFSSKRNHISSIHLILGLTAIPVLERITLQQDQNGIVLT